MQDNLEKFIRENREQFDTAEPNDKIWNNIEEDLNRQIPKEIKQHNNWYWKIAVAILLIAVGYLSYDKFNTPEPTENLSLVEEFEELESFYTSMIAEKKLELSEEMSEEDFFNYLEADIQSLDDLYKELKITFEENQETPQVKSALVHLLRQKLHLINKQLDILESMKNPEVDRTEEGLSSL